MLMLSPPIATPSVNRALSPSAWRAYAMLQPASWPLSCRCRSCRQRGRTQAPRCWYGARTVRSLVEDAHGPIATAARTSAPHEERQIGGFSPLRPRNPRQTPPAACLPCQTRVRRGCRADVGMTDRQTQLDRAASRRSARHRQKRRTERMRRSMAAASCVCSVHSSSSSLRKSWKPSSSILMTVMMPKRRQCAVGGWQR